MIKMENFSKIFFLITIISFCIIFSHRFWRTFIVPERKHNIQSDITIISQQMNICIVRNGWKNS